MKIPLTARILYAEDNNDCSEMMKVLLGFSGIEVITAMTIADAWMLARSENFDLFLLDSHFPDGNGLELCSKLHGFAPHTPIFIYSGLAYQTDKNNGFAAGADEYLVKPEIENLLKRILSAVKFSQKKRESAAGDYSFQNESRMNGILQAN